MVLGHLLSKYGRRIISPSQITFLHFDHGWRPEAAASEMRLVSEFAQSLGVQFLHRKLKSPKAERLNSNLENDARMKRQQVYDELAGHGLQYRFVITGHHQDDVVETLLWRFLRGEFRSDESGILFQDHNCLRPLLQVSKEEIHAYAKQEGVPYLEDSTNDDPGRYRSWARSSLFPMIEQHFPAVRSSLSRYAERPRVMNAPHQSSSSVLLENLLQGLVDGSLNRSQRAAIKKMFSETAQGKVLFLPGGVQLKRMKKGWLIENPDEDNQA
jgi:tRNA(Ile)-lysidine synthase